MAENVKLGAIDGLANGVGKSGAQPAGVTLTQGDPSDVLTCQTGSDIVFDTANANYYMGLAQGGSTWVLLGSVAAA